MTQVVMQRWGATMVMVQCGAACPNGCPCVSVSCLRDKGGGLVTVFIIFCRTAASSHYVMAQDATKPQEGNEMRSGKLG